MGSHHRTQANSQNHRKTTSFNVNVSHAAAYVNRNDSSMREINCVIASPHRHRIQSDCSSSKPECYDYVNEKRRNYIRGQNESILWNRHHAVEWHPSEIRCNRQTRMAINFKFIRCRLHEFVEFGPNVTIWNSYVRTTVDSFGVSATSWNLNATKWEIRKNYFAIIDFNRLNLFSIGLFCLNQPQFLIYLRKGDRMQFLRRILENLLYINSWIDKIRSSAPSRKNESTRPNWKSWKNIENGFRYCSQMLFWWIRWVLSRFSFALWIVYSWMPVELWALRLLFIRQSEYRYRTRTKSTKQK